MNVLVDNGLFMTGFPAKSGHGRIWSNLFQRLPPDIEVFTCSRIKGLPAAMPKPLRGSPLPVIRPYRYSGRILDWTAYAIDRLVPLKLLAPSLYTAGEATLRLSRRIPLVTILDDLTPEMVPGTMPHWIEPKKRTLEAASIIICISESTKSLALEHYRLPEERFRVAPLASDLVRPVMECSVRPHERPYFLVVGNRLGYKNFDLTLRAFARVAEIVPEVELLLAGPALADFELARISNLRIENRVHHAGKVDDLTLALLYAHSLALVYMSLSEGFGIPVLEAMNCGTVPIVSNRTSLPEVVGDAGLLVDPNDVEGLSETMLLVFDDAGFRDTLVSKGIERAGLYSWDRTVEIIFAAWREAAQASSRN